MASWGERYEQGEHRQVWDELVACGPEVFEPAWRQDAERVASLTMRRAASNIALLVVRLTVMGYRSGHRYDRNKRRQTIEDLGLRDSLAAAGRDVTWVDAGEMEEHVMGWVEPGPEVVDELATAERILGPLPLSLAALYRHVDAVSVSGSFPDWDPATYHFEEGADHKFGVLADPLNFHGIGMINENFPPGSAFLRPGADKEERSFPMPIAPNALLSANRPGGYHYVAVPDPVADPVIDGVFNRPGIRLVEYLRVAFAWGGFPGFEFADAVPPQIEVLRKGLLPI